MVTFLVGLVILLSGAVVYGRIAEKVVAPKDIQTPAVRLRDNVDFVPMSKWRNSLINLLNIAGTGPVLGPIQGALFGPLAFITIPIGCVLGGAFHDYMNGMISIRNDGTQMPGLVKKFLGGNVYIVYNVIVCLLLCLVGAVFIYTPGDILASQIFADDAKTLSSGVISVYGVIFAYYLTATFLPIDKIIGRIYPIFGAVLLLSSVGIFAGLFINGYSVAELWEVDAFSAHPLGEAFIPLFFVTVTCGIASGFHSTQVTLISRTVTDERHGRMTFYNMMIAEGFIAMTWAAAAMGALHSGLVDVTDLHNRATLVVGTVAKDMLGNIGGDIAIAGIIILAITSGDTALRSLRIILGDAFHINQKLKKNALAVALPLFAVVAAVLYFAKTNPAGFSVLWRYFSWANETIAAFAFAMITVYMIINKMPFFMAFLPGIFYTFIVSAYLLSSPIGFNLSQTASYVGAVIVTVLCAVLIVMRGKKMK